MKIANIILAIILTIPIYVLVGLFWLISLKDRNKPYIRTRKPYRVWQDEQFKQINKTN